MEPAGHSMKDDIFILTVHQSNSAIDAHNPDKKMLQRALKSLKARQENYLNLSTDDCNYIQVHHAADNEFYIDFRQGEESSNLFIDKQSFDITLKILIQYSQGHDFKNGHKWIKSNDSAYERGLYGEIISLKEDYWGPFQGDFYPYAEEYLSKSSSLHNNTLPQEIKGYIGYYNLTSWWLEGLTGMERRAIEEEYVYQDDFLHNKFIELSDEILDENLFDTEDETITKDIEYAKERTASGIPTDVIYSPMFLTKGNAGFLAKPAGAYLAELAGMLSNPKRFLIGLRIAFKANELLNEYAEAPASLIKAYFLNDGYTKLMKFYYRWRNEHPDTLKLAIDNAEAAIKEAPLLLKLEQAFNNKNLPGHEAYQQLAIIRYKQGDYVESIRLSSEALAQGWSGDWESRIARSEKKIAK